LNPVGLKGEVMKKSHMLALLGLLTVIGVALVGAGLLCLFQMPGYAVDQAWSELAEKHLLFVWFTGAYCCVLMTVDLWVIAGMVTKASAHQKRYF
jgi:hypothetical protein